ncbi:hypothetical protein Y032_0080g1332 [Ancylostoma ceylanicum]|uniref:Uncharacterized protein n=1 Tax=Ancylostoma ceylanicum TaxID=53326 RepID=A0A016TTJ3_9BILA|nr:hypothetical protein Y032_0080g1332 [Ancylostoma ceylanicum]
MMNATPGRPRTIYKFFTDHCTFACFCRFVADDFRRTSALLHPPLLRTNCVSCWLICSIICNHFPLHTSSFYPSLFYKAQLCFLHCLLSFSFSLTQICLVSSHFLMRSALPFLPAALARFAARRHRTAASHEDRWKSRKSHQVSCFMKKLVVRACRKHQMRCRTGQVSLTYR